MRHFIGGFVVGFALCLLGIKGKRSSLMGDYEFLIYILAHCFIGIIFGLAVWGYCHEEAHASGYQRRDEGRKVTALAIGIAYNRS